MLRSLVPLLALAFIAAPALSDARAETGETMACGKRDDLLSHLSGEYSEEPVAMGLATNGSIVEVLSSKAGGSFTIVYTTPDGLTCMMAAGNNWEFIEGQIADTKA